MGRTGARVALGDPVARLKGVGPRRAADLARLGVERAEDLLTLWPRRHEDRSRVVPIGLLGVGMTATVVARVADVRTRYVPGRDVLATVTVTDGTGVLDVVFFHARYLARHFVPGRLYVFSGRVDRRGHRLSMAHPAWEATDEEGTAAGIVPVYPLAGELTQRWLRALMAQVVPDLAAQTADPLPERIRRELGLPPRPWALTTLHFPRSLEDKERARARLVFDEVLVLALGVQWLRLREGGQGGPGVAQRPDGPTVRRLLAQLPFALTPGQQRAWEEIARDLARPVPMARLLQGDVGSGKTVLAALACCAAVDAGGQAAVMAPTELLADQQAMVLRRWLEPLGVTVARLTGHEGPRSPVRRAVAEGRAAVVVGTQALIQEGVRFADLTLVVVDEQHRFGVRQRSRLTSKGRYPDLLVMTATPIPRTLALTIYGDLERSVIDDLPPGRRPVKTVRVDQRHRRVAYEAVRAAVRRGEQAYVVCPFVEESEGRSARNAVGLYEGMRRVGGWRLGLLHGRMPPAEKEAVMERFRQGAIDVLVATSIVEVGVDVPNATVMVIEDADRFGLAQLHQLRGRVGRGTVPGTCYLVADPGSEETEARLKALVELHDGLALAEADLRIRGPGEVLGLRQHGLAGFQLADPIRDLDALQRARALAREILAGDPELRDPEHAELRRLVLDALGQAVPASILH
ncbi:MAG: ATP-dependent DNA helicase RecG [Actinomycetia bacterium]|nr:ATP-dependent DNA helicase RecG [Actinomycetes bacterium]